MKKDYAWLARTVHDLMAEGQTAAAYEACRRYCRQHRGDARGWTEWGQVAAQLGRRQDAEQHLATALRLDSGFFRAHALLGQLYERAGELEKAAASYRAALQRAPAQTSVLRALAGVLQRLQQGHEALRLYLKVLESEPRDLEVLYRVADLAREAGERETGIMALQAVLRLQPDNIGAYGNLGLLLFANGDSDAALATIRKGLRRAPHALRLLTNLATISMKAGRLEESARAAQDVLRLEPGNVEMRLLLAQLQLARDDSDAALATLDAGLQFAPQSLPLLTTRATSLMRLGRMEEAAGAAREVLRQKPEAAEMHHLLAQLEPFRHEEDPRLQAMQSLLGGERSRDDFNTRVHINFALAKAYDDLGQYRLAFDCLRRANETVRRSYHYSLDDERQLFNSIKAVFSREFFAQRQDFGDHSRLPVFILGMPRSGSTLIEQILSAHSEVYGAGELEDLRLIVTGSSDHRTLGDFPGSVLTLDRAEAGKLAQRYLERLAALGQGHPHVTDKMLANFRLLGMIHLLFPNARIIHCRRDAMATCLSCYQKLFSGHQPFAYRLDELGGYYRLYVDLMAHWQQVLPAGRILDVDYEALVSNQEHETRRILDYCGLAWQEACLSPHRARRSVLTASSQQVRRPVYRDAVSRWRHYEAFLEPLRAALAADSA